MWSNEYIGLPFLANGRGRSGIDCWGLYRLVLKEKAGVDLPAWDTVNADNGQEIADTMRLEADSEEWPTVDLADAYHFDCVLMRAFFIGRGVMYAGPTHVGCFVYPGRVLHIEKRCDSVCVPVRDVAYRITSVHRHWLLA